MIGFSFCYNGVKYTNLTLRKTGENVREENDKIFTEQIYVLGDLKIVREHILYGGEFEWSLLYFENTGYDNTRQISEIWDLDETFDDGSLRLPKGWWGGDDSTQIHLVTGCNNRFNEYRPYSEPVGAKGNYYSTDGGRSSKGFFPFFELYNQARMVGTMLAVGWSGQWQVFFDKTSNGDNLMRAGIQNSDFYLKPQEKIRTASVLVYHYRGERDEGHNTWRNFIKREISLEYKLGGSITGFAMWGGQSDEYLIAKTRQFKNAGFSFDVAHADAGWYGDCATPTQYVWSDGTETSGGWYEKVGDWYINTNLHLNGLKDVSAEFRKLGKYVSYWSEFMRAYKKCDTVKEHPEYFLKTEVADSFVVNLASEEGFEYAWRSITYLIDKGLAEVLGVDYNIDPLIAWNEEDEEGRKGLTQIKWVMGLYRLYDRFNQEKKGCFITNCASGGRSIDIEMMARTVENHRSDTHCMYDFNCADTQGHNAILSYWLPYTLTSLPALAFDVYRMRSCYAAGISVSDFCDFYSEEQLVLVKKNYDEYLSIRHFADKDFYPLFGFSREKGAWGGWQFHDKERGEGIVMAFRREESNSLESRVKLGGLNANTVYEFKDVDEGRIWQMKGEETESFSIVINGKRESKLIQYRKI